MLPPSCQENERRRVDEGCDKPLRHLLTCRPVTVAARSTADEGLSVSSGRLINTEQCGRNPLPVEASVLKERKTGAYKGPT